MTEIIYKMKKGRKKYLGEYTLTEVAELTGISVATVSRILNNKISPDSESAKKLKEFLRRKELSFDSLKNRAKVNIYLVCDFLGDETTLPITNFPYIYRSLLKKAELDGFNLIHTQRKGINPILNSTKGDSIRGIIFHCHPFDLDKHVPSVVINHNIFATDRNLVYADLIAGYLKALEYLKENGHERIGFFLDCDKTENFFPDYIKFMPFIYESAGVEWDENLFWGRSFSYGQHRQIIEEALGYFLKMKRPPTAIILLNDFYATDFFSVVHSLGMSIPNDISLFGTFNAPICTTLPVPLSSIEICPDSIADEAISIINQSTQNPKLPTRKVAITPELVIRESIRKI